MSGVDWNRETAPFVGREIAGTWREFCDRLHVGLIERWVPGHVGGPALKTDLFDEACGDGLVDVLAQRSTEVYGIDIAADVVTAAAVRHPGIAASVDDVRDTRFAADSFALVVSNSTLDHFDSRADIDAAVREIHRVMALDGTLIITMDNPVNPLIALRAVLPKKLMRATGLVPYFVGHTLSRRRLTRTLEAAGFEVVDCQPLMHAPRILAIPMCRRADARRSDNEERIVARLLRWEKLGQSPTRWLTAHYVAMKARRR